MEVLVAVGLNVFVGGGRVGLLKTTTNCGAWFLDSRVFKSSNCESKEVIPKLYVPLPFI